MQNITSSASLEGGDDGFLDRILAGDARTRASALLRLPSALARASASGWHLFGAPLPTPPIPLFTLRHAPRDAQRKTRGRVDR